MAETIRCPNCQRMLQIQEVHLGDEVRCPSCQQVFTSSRPSPPPRPVPSDAPPSEVRPPRPRRDSLDFEREERYYDEEEEEYRRTVPHRGGVILTLGILGLVFSCCPLAGWIFGGYAMSMGNEDLLRMARGSMDRSGQGMTQAGKILGLIAVILASFSCIANLFFKMGGLRW
jgi:hypothetical protein